MLLKQYLPEQLKGWLFDLQHLGTYSAHPQPLFILGNQKSGTSVVAALLAELTGIPLTLDLTRERFIPTYQRVVMQELSMAEFIQINRAEFVNPIIKEPNLSLLYEPLAQHFPGAKFLMVIRDPRDNIRSILDRLKLPGNLAQLPPVDLAKLTPAWQLILQSPWLTRPPSQSYIAQLAKRWQVIAQSYLQHAEQIQLIRYEDFLKDKRGKIEQIAQQFNLPAVNNIDDKLDVQYQPAGNRNAKWEPFFESANLRLIESICGSSMAPLGYPYS